MLARERFPPCLVRENGKKGKRWWKNGWSARGIKRNVPLLTAPKPNKRGQSRRRQRGKAIDLVPRYHEEERTLSVRLSVAMNLISCRVGSLTVRPMSQLIANACLATPFDFSEEIPIYFYE